jgi:hypothetical protein
MKGSIMRIRNIFVSGTVVTALAVGGMTAATLTDTAPAHASGTNVSTSTTTKVMLNSLCYEESTRTVTLYHHSAGHGWVAYPSPKVTTSKSEHCYAR